MGELTCTPWRRYGHDRVYVARGDDRLGYLNRATGELVLDDDAALAEATAALVAGGFLAAPPSTEPSPAPFAPPPGPPAPAASEPPPAPPEPEPPAARAAPAPEPPPDAAEWALTLPGDTATYRAGAGAREMAQAARAAAPVRTALARLLGVHTDERAWRVGAAGEEAVARRLAKLPPAWTVVHDLPIGNKDANVDHLVAGPGGVYSLNTKNLTGKVWVGGTTFLHNGHRTHYVRNARHEASRVARLLTNATGMAVDARGLVVVIADELTVKEQPADVTVVTAREVVRWLTRRPVVLEEAALARVVRAVRDPRTWRPR